ncbi:hypothetical protein PR202_gb07834 [Eleusine coracana subsp. coracana]|uniref:Uncharacterized protein n=1 Tax=Eleusine coracana subsp. coracana TaxID=191504 RepID=A0AAV5EDL4_ELECO|nr:hypothetical protein PR202_gb07834 [Eleusine coracana subsp. coracana]
MSATKPIMAPVAVVCFSSSASSYASVVGVIHDTTARVNTEYIQSFIDNTAVTPGMAFCPDLEVDSWLGFRFHDLDFGHGPPCVFLPPYLTIEGVMFFVRSCTAACNIDLHSADLEDHVDVIKQICYSMD